MEELQVSNSGGCQTKAFATREFQYILPSSVYCTIILGNQTRSPRKGESFARMSPGHHSRKSTILNPIDVPRVVSAQRGNPGALQSGRRPPLDRRPDHLQLRSSDEFTHQLHKYDFPIIRHRIARIDTAPVYCRELNPVYVQGLLYARYH